MGRRARRRGAPAAPPPPPAARSSRRERPRAPWHPFPLVELCVLIGIGLMVWGSFRADDPGGRMLLLSGLVIGSLAGLETALREHFSGFASHAVQLAALPAILAAGALFLARAPWITVPLAGAGVFGAAFAALRRAFRRRS
jgi:uncharacterized membrane protein